MISSVLVFKGNRPTDWGPDRGGGVQIGRGGTGKGFVVEYIFCIGGMWGKNFLKFSQIFSKGGGVPDRGGLSYTFLVLEFLWGKIFLKFSQIFSEYIFMYWHSGKIFSNFLKFSQNFQLILNKIFVPNDVGWGADWVGWSRLGGGMPDTVLVFDYFLGKLSHLFELCFVGLIRKCSLCGACFVY